MTGSHKYIHRYLPMTVDDTFEYKKTKPRNHTYSYGIVFVLDVLPPRRANPRKTQSTEMSHRPTRSTKAASTHNPIQTKLEKSILPSIQFKLENFLGYVSIKVALLKLRRDVTFNKEKKGYFG